MALWQDFKIDDDDEQVRLNIRADINNDDEETVHFENVALYDDEYSKLNVVDKYNNNQRRLTIVQGGIIGATMKQKTLVRFISCLLVMFVVLGVILWTTKTKSHRKDIGKTDSISTHSTISISEECSEKKVHGSSTSACNDLCLPHACCWDSEKYNDDLNCLSTRKDCAIYEPCIILLHHRKPKIKAPPENINELCALTSVKGEGNEKVLIDIDNACRNTCLPGECCLEISAEAECFSQNEEVCALYNTPCSHIPSSGFISDYGGKLPPVPNSLPIACAPNQSNEELIELCKSFCATALCCIGKGNLANCAADDSIFECQEYKEYCLDVWPDSDSIRIPTTAIDTLCSDANIQTKHGMAECHRICFLGSCCWDSNEQGNCYKGDEYICDKYSPCKGLIFHNMVMPVPQVPIPDSDLETVCGVNAISSFPVMQQCIQACASGSCCFGFGQNNCASENTDVCLKYKPCENLPLFDRPQNSPLSPLEVICSPKMLQTVEGFATCSKVCKPGTCCNEDPPNSCYAMHPDACEEYEPCRSIKVVPPPPPGLYDKCSAEKFTSEELILLCEDACKPSSCCWEDGYGNCLANNPDVCSQYSVCVDIPEPVHDLSPIAIICSPESLGAKDGRKKCLGDCQEAWCCISEGKGNCVEDKSDFCFEYIPFCKDILLNTQLDVDDIDDPLTITCSKQNIVTKSGRESCEKECSQFACCLAKGDKFNCYSKDPMWCDSRIKICNVLDASSWITPEHIQIPYAASNIIELCPKDSLSTFSGRRDCEQVCEPSSCCWDEIVNRNCRKQNKEACASYSICEKLLH